MNPLYGEDRPMSSPFSFDSRVDELDRIIDSLRELEESLKRIVEQFESVLEQVLVRSEEQDIQKESMEDQEKLERGLDKKGVILISEKKMRLIPKEELPRVLRSNLGKMVEYKIDTVEQKSALEKLLSTLEKKKRMGK